MPQKAKPRVDRKRKARIAKQARKDKYKPNRTEPMKFSANARKRRRAEVEEADKRFGQPHYGHES